jgi:hypothetical protein
MYVARSDLEGRGPLAAFKTTPPCVPPRVIAALHASPLPADTRRMPVSRHLIGAPLLALALVAALPSPASADASFFFGTSRNPSSHLVKGGAFGIGLLIVGFEAEGAIHEENAVKGIPGLKTGMGNVLLQTPTGNTQFYATTGAGLYRETLGTTSETSFATNIGGGVKVGLAGPLRLRLDFRVIHLMGTPRYPTIQRFYAGINLKF